MFYVDSMSSIFVEQGRTLTVFGGFFDVHTVVLFDGQPAFVKEYTESSVTAIVPNTIGIRSDVSVSDGVNTVYVGFVRKVQFADAPVYDYIRDYSQDDFEQMILGMFPKGQLFDLQDGSNFKKIVTGLALALLYVWALIRSMQEALNPLHTENIDRWEKALNLPEVGVTHQDDDGRRREIYRVWGTEGGCSINYYKQLITLLGISASLYEYCYNVSKFDDVVFGENDDPRFFLMIRFRIHRQEIQFFTAGVSGAGSRVMDYTDNFLENIFEKSKQSHVKIIYSYITEQNVALITDDGKNLVTDDGKKLIGFQFME